MSNKLPCSIQLIHDTVSTDNTVLMNYHISGDDTKGTLFRPVILGATTERTKLCIYQLMFKITLSIS